MYIHTYIYTYIFYIYGLNPYKSLSHRDRMTHICGSKLGHHMFSHVPILVCKVCFQVIIWTNASRLWIVHMGTNVGETSIKIKQFHTRKYIWQYGRQNCCHFVSALIPHWGPVTYICVSKLNRIGLDNDLWPGRRHNESMLEYFNFDP